MSQEDINAGVPKNQMFKFVQVCIDEDIDGKLRRVPFIVSKPNDVYHGNMLKEILEKKQIKDIKVRKVDGFPELEGDKYKVAGMGILIKSDEKTFLFYSKSDSYGLGPNSKHVEYWKKYHGLEDLKINII